MPSNHSTVCTTESGEDITSSSNAASPPPACVYLCKSIMNPGYMNREIRKFERINSMRETNGSFDSCNSCKPDVCMTCMSQNFCLFLVSNLFVQSFRISLLTYPESLLGRANSRVGLDGKQGGAGWRPTYRCRLWCLPAASGACPTHPINIHYQITSPAPVRPVRITSVAVGHQYWLTASGKVWLGLSRWTMMSHQSSRSAAWNQRRRAE